MPPTHGVKVELDQVRTLRYTERSLYRLEEETGKTLTEMGDRLRKGSLQAITSLLWAGLLHAEPRITVDDVLKRMEDSRALKRLGEIGGKIGEAIEAAMGAEGSAEAAEGNPEAAA